MVLKPSWMVIVAIILGQSSVLAAPVKRHFQPDLSDLPLKGKYDKNQPYSTDYPATSSDHTAYEGGDSYGNFPKKVNHGSISDANSRTQTSGSHDSKELPYPETSACWLDKKGVVTEPTYTEDLNNSATYPVDHSGGDSYGKKKSKPIDGTISEPTYTDGPNNSPIYPIDDKTGDSYGKKTIKPTDGTISDPTFTDDPRSHTVYAVGCYCEGKEPTKLVGGTISDRTHTEDPKNSTPYPLKDDNYGKKSSKLSKGTISHPDSRSDHPSTGKPCTVPNSNGNEILPNSKKNTSYLGDEVLNCTWDLKIQKKSKKFLTSNSHDKNLGPHPHIFGNGDDTNRSI